MTERNELLAMTERKEFLAMTEKMALPLHLRHARSMLYMCST